VDSGYEIVLLSAQISSPYCFSFVKLAVCKGLFAAVEAIHIAKF